MNIFSNVKTKRLVNMNDEDDRNKDWSLTKNFSHRRTSFFEPVQNSQHRWTLTWRKKICWCGWLGQISQPRLASSHWLGHLPSLALLLYKKKTCANLNTWIVKYMTTFCYGIQPQKEAELFSNNGPGRVFRRSLLNIQFWYARAWLNSL